MTSSRDSRSQLPFRRANLCATTRAASLLGNQPRRYRTLRHRALFPAPPPTAMKPNDSATLTLTINFGSSSSITSNAAFQLVPSLVAAWHCRTPSRSDRRLKCECSLAPQQCQFPDGPSPLGPGTHSDPPTATGPKRSAAHAYLTLPLAGGWKFIALRAGARGRRTRKVRASGMA
ncbi:hypothetical protein BKA81DRAFT_382679 [Phyllosticta paracitricarpa]